MPRDLTRQLFDERIKAQRQTRIGETLTRFVLTPYDTAGVLMPVADIVISGAIVSGVPLAANNRQLTYVVPGTPVTLARSETGRLEVTGLSKRGYGNTFTYTIDIPEITPQTSNGGSALRAGATTSVAVIGFRVRTANLGELATVTTLGFGETPLQAALLLDGEGNVIRIIR